MLSRLPSLFVVVISVTGVVATVAGFVTVGVVAFVVVFTVAGAVVVDVGSVVVDGAVVVDFAPAFLAVAVAAAAYKTTI